MHLKILSTLCSIALLSACSSGEDSPPAETPNTPSPTNVAAPTASSPANASNAHLENGLPPVIEQF